MEEYAKKYCLMYLQEKKCLYPESVSIIMFEETVYEEVMLKGCIRLHSLA